MSAPTPMSEPAVFPTKDALVHHAKVHGFHVFKKHQIWVRVGTFNCYMIAYRDGDPRSGRQTGYYWTPMEEQ